MCSRGSRGSADLTDIEHGETTPFLESDGALLHLVHQERCEERGPSGGRVSRPTEGALRGVEGRDGEDGGAQGGSNAAKTSDEPPGSRAPPDGEVTSGHTAPEAGFSDISQSRKSSGYKKKSPNAFILWSRTQRGQLTRANPGATSADISVQLGAKWTKMTEEQKMPYFEEACKLKQTHSWDFSGWVFQKKSAKRKLSKQKEATAAKAAVISSVTCETGHRSYSVVSRDVTNKSCIANTMTGDQVFQEVSSLCSRLFNLSEGGHRMDEFALPALIGAPTLHLAGEVVSVPYQCSVAAQPVLNPAPAWSRGVCCSCSQTFPTTLQLPIHSLCHPHLFFPATLVPTLGLPYLSPCMSRAHLFPTGYPNHYNPAAFDRRGSCEDHFPNKEAMFLTADQKDEFHKFGEHSRACQEQVFPTSEIPYNGPSEDIVDVESVSPPPTSDKPH